jgi:uncharacterized repeat protein (TIGR01451 family)
VVPATNNVVFYPTSPQNPTVQVGCVVTNQGNGVAASANGYWYDTVYVSTNTSISGAVSSQQFTESGPVAVGGAYRPTNTITLPQQSGTYYLIYQANYYFINGGRMDIGVWEANTANNVLVSGPVLVVPNSSGLAISEWAGPNPVFTLNNLTYTVSVLNRGPLAASGVVVSNPLPSGVAFISCQPSQGTFTYSGSTVTWNLGSLANGASASATIVVSPGNPGSITDTVTVSASSASPSTNTTASAVTTVLQNPAGPLLKIASAGSNVVLSWSASASGYYLQSKTSLASASAWSMVTDVPVVVGGTCYVTNALTGPSKFYRLSNQPLPPSLTVMLVPINNIVLLWPTTASGFTLQSTTNLQGTTLWTSVTNTPVVVGSNYAVTNTTSGNRRFYRLVH